jgi:hypothetical protein
MQANKKWLIFAFAVAAAILAVAISVRMRSDILDPHAVQAAARPQTPTQSASWNALATFAQQASSGDPSQSLIVNNWQSRCSILGGGQCPSTLFYGKGFMFHSSPLAVRNAKLLLAAQKKAAKANNHAARAIALDDIPANTLETGVFYNVTAADCLRQIVHLPLPGPTNCPTTDPNAFNEGSMIFRPIWGILGSDTTTAPIYIPGITQATPSNPAGSQIASWAQETLDRQAADCPTTIQAGDPIPVVCFYRVTVSANNLSFFETGADEIEAGNTLILLGFHLIERQNGQWLWSTFGWQSQTSIQSYLPYSCDDANACLASAPFWSHYKMNAVEPIATGASLIPAVFNPYLDSGTMNNSRTNCVVCHSLAGSPMGSNQKRGGAGPISQPALQALIDKYASGAHFNSTDSIWSAAAYLDSPTLILLNQKKAPPRPR